MVPAILMVVTIFTPHLSWQGTDEDGRTDDLEMEGHIRQGLIESDLLTLGWPREYGGQDAFGIVMLGPALSRPNA